MTEASMTRAELKAICLALLDEAALDHPAGHQGKLAARYILRAGDGERIGMMFEKHEATKAHLWLEQRHARHLMDAGIDHRVYPAAALYQEGASGEKQAYGRHAALKAMRDLANADLVRFTIDRVGQMEMILTKLAAAQQVA